MRVIVTGSGGNLGTHLMRQAIAGWEIHGTWHRREPSWPLGHQVDLAAPGAMAALCQKVRPELIVHTAFSQQDMDRNIVQATEQVASAARDQGAALIHMSTDMVFDGNSGPYSEADEPRPIFPYGQAKAAAERIVRELLPGAAIVRASLIIGLEPLNHSSAWLIDALRKGARAMLFVDEVRTPIAADDLAAMLWEIAALPSARQGGVWHLAGPESLSRFALGLLLARHFGLDPSLLQPVLNRELAEPRPRDLRINTRRADAELRHRPRSVSEVLALGSAVAG